MKRFEIFFGIIKIPVDFAMTVLAFLAAYQLRLITEPISGIAKPIDYSVLPTLSEYFTFSAYLALALIVIFIFGKMYTIKTTLKFSKESRKVLIFWSFWAMSIITWFFFTRTFPFSRLAIIYSWTLTLIFILSGRGLVKMIQTAFLKKGIGQRKILIIGKNQIADKIEQTLQREKTCKILEPVKADDIEELEKIIKNKKPDEIIQTVDQNSSEILELCDIYHVDYRFVPDLIDVRHRQNIDIETLNGIPLIALKKTPLDGWNKVTKRSLDIIGAIFGFIIFSPLFLGVALAIKINSKGPILFSKLDDGSPAQRIGQKGKPFTFYKFRSMYPNTHSKRFNELKNLNTREDGPLMKIKNDPRVTGVGRFIRKYSLDELPQLYNVLIGNMSLVGPRPHLPEEVENYQKHDRFLLTIKPGLTGLAQISGRSDLKFEEEARLDRYYIENWSIFKDLKIISKTLFVVIRGHQE
ncbi:sugar transferase [Candidatus Peregrinibacteria bacterium]|nr:sugar transferase [Candidatus Peregrinibacteria bacterium]